MTENIPKTWAALAAKDLKNRSLAELTWAAPEGFAVKPLYTEADLEGVETETEAFDEAVAVVRRTHLLNNLPTAIARK